MRLSYIPATSLLIAIFICNMSQFSFATIVKFIMEEEEEEEMAMMKRMMTRRRKKRIMTGRRKIEGCKPSQGLRILEMQIKPTVNNAKGLLCSTQY